MRAATGEACDGSSNLANPRKIAPAIWATIKETPTAAANREGQVVTALFIPDSQIIARKPPFRTVRQNSLPSGAELSEQMREFVKECALDFFGTLVTQEWIERNQPDLVIRSSRTALQAPIPFDPELRANAA